MLKDDQVMGTGAIKYLDNEICELRRLFFAREYRGLDFGSKMLTNLVQCAKKLGYKKMRLDVYNPEKQIAAVNLFKNLVSIQ